MSFDVDTGKSKFADAGSVSIKLTTDTWRRKVGFFIRRIVWSVWSLKPHVYMWLSAASITYDDGMFG